MRAMADGKIEKLFDEMYDIVSRIHEGKANIDIEGKRANDIANELNKLGFSDRQIAHRLDFRYASEKMSKAFRSITRGA